MATNILAIPLVQASVTTGNNEDWIDSFQYLADDEVTPLDISGIEFAMEVRRLAGDADVVLTASTADARLSVGGTGNSYLLISVPITLMKILPPGDYVADVVATADGITRTTIQLSPLTVFQGITINGVPAI